MSLGAFWARRARRLLPALLLVICVLAVTAPLLLPAAEVRLLRGDGLAALFYIANWRMILRGGDYFAQTSAPSPLEHTWSLAVEEQFYLVWPVLLVVLLAGAMTAAHRRQALRRVLVFCGLVAVASTVLLAQSYDPMDPGRAYYGTDTRAASLVIGAGLAVVLARYRPQAAGWVTSRRVRRALGVLAAGAVLVLAWAWTHADGGDRWLYRGGLAAMAFAVAVVLAYVVLVPRGWLARLLALAPLVLLGRISYGVYLWHWPVFIAVNAGRTGREGGELFALRCLITLALATLCYVLVERPVRNHRFGSRRPRLRRAGGRTRECRCGRGRGARDHRRAGAALRQRAAWSSRPPPRTASARSHRHVPAGRRRPRTRVPSPPGQESQGAGPPPTTRTYAGRRRLR